MPTTDRRCGRYELLEPVGRGAMGIVYLAEDPVIHRTVAVKVLHTNHGLTPQQIGLARERFTREGQAAGSIDHPNIIRVLDVGEDDSTRELYIVMEFVSGPNLETVLGEGPVELERALSLIAQIASGLDAAHARGIVHRDIKPSNILVTVDGIVKIADFGITQVARSALTLDMRELGTPAYMSPEQVNGKLLDSRADLFSLGVLAYELLAGRKPFDGADVVSIAHAIAYSDPTPISAVNALLPKTFDHVMAKALAKDPSERFESGRELHEALLACWSERGAGRSPMVTPPTTTKRRAAVWILSSVALAAAAAFALSLRGWTEAPNSGGAPRAVPVAKAVVAPPKPEAKRPAQKPAPARKPPTRQPAKPASDPPKVQAPIPAPSARPSAEARAAAPPVAKAVPGSAPAAGANATVTIKFAHRMKRGTLVVLLDGEPIFEESFSKARLALVQTTVWDPLKAPAGGHMLRARVSGENGKTYVSAFYKVDFPREQTVDLRIDLKGDTLTVKQGAGS